MVTQEPDSTPPVLVVDDEPLVLQLMARALKEAGYAPFTAGGALQALELLGRLPAHPLARVTDIRMDPIDGPGLAKILRLQCPGLPVLFVSGFGPGDQYGNLPGALLEKPFQTDQLVAAVAGLLGAPRLAQGSS
jgi:DNA-binding NtrC family response regulator